MRKGNLLREELKIILDCACGANHVKYGVEEVIGVDIAYSCCEVATKPDILCDAHHLPFIGGLYEGLEGELVFSEAPFTMVFSSHTLEHVRTPFEILKEFRRVGKRLIIRVPNVEFYRGSVNEDPDHFHCWNMECFCHLLQLVYPNVKVRTRFDWVIRGYSAGKGLLFRQIAIVKKLFFVLMMNEYSELEAVCW